MSITRTGARSTKLLLLLFLFYVSLLNLETFAEDGNGVSCSSSSSPPRTNSSDEEMEKITMADDSSSSDDDDDDEINLRRRRVLIGTMMKRKYYISYDTLKKDIVPCERPGASYYNCRSAGVANPYTRGCQVITGCARDLRDIIS